MNKKILEIKKLSISFDSGKTYILKDISFSVSPGEVLSIIGVNGAGKSTLLKTIAQINKNFSGEIIRNYKSLSYVPQKIDIDKTFPIKVYEFIKIYNKIPHPNPLFGEERGQFENNIKNYLEKFLSKRFIG
ncbi:MAG: ATP-binding cassette domain-containing protein [Candidatus Gracilibacteria bacterium]|nr:ATP-binding cassette domain-containing protein [Candidatus Gracilibacteria bacterium]